jgi:carboxypeptidase D
MPSNATAPSGGSAPSNGSTTGWIVPQTDETLKFKVDGKGLPDVPFDIGESYAGSLPISNKTNSSELFFWFFPSENAAATDEILIWLNGGPGCSSLMGLLQENGNFLWQTGERRPVKNSWAWTKLTNVVWIEQPAGTGFSRLNGNQGPQNEYEMAEQFLGFWKNFVDTFQLHNRKVFITGESYAGQ